MGNWPRLSLILAIIIGPGMLLILSLVALVDRTFPIFVSMNIIVALDRVLGSWIIFPPVFSWMFLGFVTGALVYFAIWEAHRLERPRLRSSILAAPFVLLLVSFMVWPDIEMRYGVPMWLRLDTRTVAPGQERHFEGMAFVWVPPGRFRMGSPPEEPMRESDEIPHLVTLSDGFWIGKHEVTQAQWAEIMGENPSASGRGDPESPVDSVTWEDCARFVERLNARAGGGFRLPTEAEWECAARAGAGSAYSFGDDPAALSEYAWFESNADGSTRRVGEKAPNAWGLHDMQGNVWEWCQDWYGPYPEDRTMDPVGPAAGQYRVLRGGSWTAEPRDCRVSRRFVYLEGYGRPKHDIGVRLVRLSDHLLQRVKAATAEREAAAAAAQEDLERQPPEEEDAAERIRRLLPVQQPTPQPRP